jgi:Transposase DDE domain group 1
VKQIVRQRMVARKRRSERRLDRNNLRGCERPIIQARNIHYELAGRSQGTCFGGIGAMHALVQQLGLAKAIDERLQLLKIHLPYHESDHVLHFAYNALCEGTCLEDMELRRQDAAYLDALGARRLPDPTTAGDFCRRFHEHHLRTLMDVFDQIRLQVWKRQAPEFFEQAIIDVDGTLVGTTGACKQGMDYSYQGQWGYHPLVTSLANTGEVLSIVNRPGNRPSHEGAAGELDRAQKLCRRAGFRRILLRGDTDFTQTTQLDRWTDDPRVQFIFGMDVQPSLHVLVDDSCEGQWKKLERPPRYQVQTAPRARPENVKEQIVREREYRNIRLESEDVAELEYRPTACRKTYRLVVVRKNLSIEQGELRLFDDYRYFFYLTNDRSSTAAEIVYLANDRCNQENLHAQLKGGVRSLQAPVDSLLSNWAYMLMTSLAWNLKAWWALWLPEPKGRWAEKHREQRQTVLQMEFKTFRNYFIKLPCQIVRTGRKLVYRLLAWNIWQPVFFRLSDRLRC